MKNKFLLSSLVITFSLPGFCAMGEGKTYYGVDPDTNLECSINIEQMKYLRNGDLIILVQTNNKYNESPIKIKEVMDINGVKTYSNIAKRYFDADSMYTFGSLMGSYFKDNIAVEVGKSGKILSYNFSPARRRNVDDNDGFGFSCKF